LERILAPVRKALRLLDLPTYTLDNKNYWISYLGNWALLKGRANGAESDAASDITLPTLPLELQTSSIHGLVEEDLDEKVVRLVVETNILDPDVAGAVNGHAKSG
jgi:monodictyphenone polyketide synthase